MRFLARAREAEQFENLFSAHQLLRQLRLPFLQLPEIRNGGFSAKEEAFHTVLEHIGTHYMEPIQMSDLAKLAKMEKNRFSATFRKRFGVAPKEYLTNTRIARAKELLLNTGWTVMQCGFHDDLFFYRIFRRHTGMSPMQYRRTMYSGF